MNEALLLVLGFALGFVFRNIWNDWAFKRWARNIAPSSTHPPTDPNWQPLEPGDTHTLEDDKENLPNQIEE